MAYEDLPDDKKNSLSAGKSADDGDFDLDDDADSDDDADFDAEADDDEDGKEIFDENED